jgi:glutaredoxin 2
MKNFSDLLATDQHLAVCVNNTVQSVGWSILMEFDANDCVTVDDVEILPKYRHLAVNGRLTIPEPFYRWYHRVSGQGWLLTPQ